MTLPSLTVRALGLLLVSTSLAAQSGTCGTCPSTGACPGTHPLTTGSNHACEDHAGHDHSSSQFPQIDLSFADFELADVSFVIAPNAVMDGIRLTGAQIAHSDFSSSSLAFAELAGADLAHARIANADLRFADLTGATGLGTAFGAPLYNCHTLFTGTGFDPAAAGWTSQACPSLAADRPTLSLSAGGSQRLFLSAGSQYAGKIYLIVGSASGTSPGTPIGDLVLPLNTPDPWFGFTLSYPNTPLLPLSLGFLDASATLRTAFTLPPASPAILAGFTFHHAYVVVEGSSVTYASAAVPVTFTP